MSANETPSDPQKKAKKMKELTMELWHGNELIAVGSIPFDDTPWIEETVTITQADAPEDEQPWEEWHPAYPGEPLEWTP